LFLDDVAGHAQAKHAEGVPDPAQRLDLRLQAGNVALSGTQVQVERILDPQQVFLDRRRHRVQQRAVVAADAAPRMRDLGFARRLRGEVESVAQVLQADVVGLGMGDVIEQLPGRLERGVGARHEAIVLEQVAGFALDAGECLAQRRRRRQRAVAHGVGNRRCDPQHAAAGFVAGLREQAVDRGRQPGGAGRRALLGPRHERVLQLGQQWRSAGFARLPRTGGRRLQRGR